MLKYSIEQLVHFQCECGYHWTHSGEMPNWEWIHCPKCNDLFSQRQLEDVTNRTLIEAFADEVLLTEVAKRGYNPTPATDRATVEMLRILKGRV